MSGDAIYFDKPSFLCDEGAWVRALDYAVHAETVKTFRKRIEGWLPFFPDAATQVAAMNDDWAAYNKFRRGLQAEREKRFAGEEWAEKFGAILIPGNAIRATQLSRSLQVPWGAAVIRVADLPEEQSV
jgi:hypothetical protein